MFHMLVRTRRRGKPGHGTCAVGHREPLPQLPHRFGQRRRALV